MPCQNCQFRLREGFLWVEATQVTQKALSERFLTFPAILFEKVFKQ
jgi:hypothetical protein